MLSKGVVLMLGASFCFALMNVCVKMVGHIPVLEIVFFRSLIAAIICIFTIYFNRKNGALYFGKKENRFKLIGRGFFGAIGLILFFQTIQNMPLASAVVVHYLAPIFTATIAIFMLSQAVKPYQWVFFAVSFAGVLMVKGFDARIDSFYLILGVLGAIASGFAYNFIAQVKKTEHPATVIFFFPLITIPFTFVYLFFDFVMPSAQDALLLLLIGVLTQMAQMMMTKAYMSEKAAKVASVNYVGVVYAIGFGYFLFEELIDWKTFLGIAVVLLGVLLNVAFPTLYNRWFGNQSKA